MVSTLVRWTSYLLHCAFICLLVYCSILGERARLVLDVLICSEEGKAPVVR